MINIENMLDEIGETVEETSRLEREIERLQRENEKLSVDSVALDKIIKIIEDWRECYAPDRAHITLDEISAAIEGRGD